MMTATCSPSTLTTSSELRVPGQQQQQKVQQQQHLALQLYLQQHLTHQLVRQNSSDFIVILLSYMGKTKNECTNTTQLENEYMRYQKTIKNEYYALSKYN